MELLISKYFLVFLAAFVEGPLVAVGTGFLIKLGYLSLIPTVIALIMGDFVPDTICYYIGRYGNRSNIIKKYGKYLGMTEEYGKTLENLWLNHSKKAMFFSKLAYGLSMPFLVTAGFAKMPPSKFWGYSITITILHYGTLMTLGYFFGQSYESLIVHYAQYVELIFIVSASVIILGIYLFKKWLTKYSKKKLFV